MKSIVFGSASRGKPAFFAASCELDAAACSRGLALAFVASIAIACTVESSGQGTPETISESSSAELQSNCGCSKTGTYVSPSMVAPLSNSPMFTVATVVTNGSTAFTVRRRSDNSTVYTTSAPVPTPSNPNPAVFGFSPDGNRFLYRYSQQGADHVFLVDLSTGFGRVVYSRAVYTSSSGSDFSPHGRYLLYGYVTGSNTINLNIVDTASGATAYSAVYNIFTQTVPPPGATFGVGTEGFSPDDETFVSGHVSGQGLSQWNLVNVVKGTQVASQRFSGVGGWKFSPCSDVFGVVEITSQGIGQGLATVSLFRTADGSNQGGVSKQASFPLSVQLSTTTTNQVAEIANTTFNLAPNAASADCTAKVQLIAVAVSPTSVVSGQAATGTVRLAYNAPASGVTVSLESSNPALVTVPSSVAVSAGTALASFPITTGTTSATVNVTITATLGTASKTAILQVTGPLSCGGVICAAPTQCQTSVSCSRWTGRCTYSVKPQMTTCDDGDPNTVGDACRDGTCTGTRLLASVAVSPTSVASGQAATGTVRLAYNAPAGGVTVSLESSNPALVMVPSSVAVSAGKAVASFPITTGAVSTATNVSIVATLGTASKTAILRVTGPLSCGGVVCAPPNQCQTSVSCSYAPSRCAYILKPAATPCDDGNPNTVGDVCTDGACLGVDHCVGVTCPSIACHAGVCDHATGACTNAAVPDGTACDDGDPSTTSDICSAGVCKGSPASCVETNLALNVAGTGFPSPLESSAGWGGGAKSWEILDGKTAYSTWDHGLAFTGGIPSYGGEACGDRYAVVDFGQPTTFRSARVWHYDGTNDVPDVYRMEYWDGSAWLPTGGTDVLRTDLNSNNSTDPNAICGSIPQEFTFPPVTASKVRYMMNNCDMELHGWLYEVEIIGCRTASP